MWKLKSREIRNDDTENFIFTFFTFIFALINRNPCIIIKIYYKAKNTIHNSQSNLEFKKISFSDNFQRTARYREFISSSHICIQNDPLIRYRLWEANFHFIIANVPCKLYNLCILFRLAYPPLQGYDLCLTRDATDQYITGKQLWKMSLIFTRRKASVDRAIFAPCLLKPYGLMVTRSRKKTCI